jgi:hypothetical protein
MMKSKLILAATLLVASVAGAQEQTGTGQMGIGHEPVTCIRGGEMPSLQMKVEGKGELRAYFRRINTTDWCSVEGTNDGPLSRVTLPKFEAGDEIEYFFVLLDNRRVLARSARIYRAKVTESCETAWVRYDVRLTMDCGDNAPGSIPSSMGAGYSVNDTLVDGNPPYGSPDRPNPAGAPWTSRSKD